MEQITAKCTKCNFERDGQPVRVIEVAGMHSSTWAHPVVFSVPAPAPDVTYLNP